MILLHHLQTVAIALLKIQTHQIKNLAKLTYKKIRAGQDLCLVKVDQGENRDQNHLNTPQSRQSRIEINENVLIK
jgi:hypothetical protein